MAFGAHRSRACLRRRKGISDVSTRLLRFEFAGGACAPHCPWRRKEAVAGRPLFMLKVCAANKVPTEPVLIRIPAVRPLWILPSEKAWHAHERNQSTTQEKWRSGFFRYAIVVKIVAAAMAGVRTFTESTGNPVTTL